jgi:RES domain-containing protein
LPVLRGLERELRVWRIGDPDGVFPVWDAGGAMLNPGRWNAAREPMLYTATSYSLALVEKLVHWNGVLPNNQHFLDAVIPVGVSYEVLNPVLLPGWESPAQVISRNFGSTWLREKRSAILFVPSAPAPIEQNVLINMAHPEAQRILPGREIPIWWDKRLFGLPTP